jgi:vitamin B12/bleomycin/antimicrobial peptide transport system ATP-binding/permease protein
MITLKKLLNINAFLNEVKMSLLKASFTGVKSLIIPTGIIVTGAVLLYFLNNVYGDLYNAIQAYKPIEAWRAVATFTGLAFCAVVLDSYKTFELNKLTMKMRTSLLTFLIKNEYTDPANNHLTTHQRLQEDTFKFTEITVELAVAFFEAAIKIPLFIGVIVTLTDWRTGAIVLVSVIAGTILSKVISTKLVTARSEYESAEAILRESLKTKTLKATIYDIVLKTYDEYNKQLKKLTFVTGLLGQGFVLLPFILLLPLYFAKVLTLGSFFQSVKALDKIIQSLSVIIDNRNKITMYLTSKKRLEELLK